MRALFMIIGVLAILAGLFSGLIAFAEAGGLEGFRYFRPDRLLSSDDARLASMGLIAALIFAFACFDQARRYKHRIGSRS